VKTGKKKKLGAIQRQKLQMGGYRVLYTIESKGRNHAPTRERLCSLPASVLMGKKAERKTRG